MRRFTPALWSMCFAAAGLLGPALVQAQVRVATYNTLDGPVNASEEGLVQTIFGAIGNKSANGIAKRVDIIGLQEQGSGTAVRFANAMNSLYGVSSYQAEVLDFGFDSLAYVYDSSTVTKVSSQLIGVGIRPGHRIQWRPVGYDNSAADFYTYNVHLKAGSSGSDASQRANETTNMRTNADALGQGAQIIYMGDFNAQGPFEQSIQNLTAAGNGQAIDPLGLPFWSGISNAAQHSQSTRTSQLPDGGANGGMDDRFDLQYLTSELLDGHGMSYIGPSSTGGSGLSHSYQAFGNDGTTFNNAINANTAGRSQPVSVLNALHNFSDHLPVVADYQLPAKAELLASIADTRVIAGEVTLVSATVENVAPVSVDNAADTLDYTISGSGSAFLAAGPQSPTGSLTVSDAPNPHFYLASATSAGSFTFDLNLESNDQGQTNGIETQSFNLIGLDHANASFSGALDVDSITIDFGQVNVGEGGGTLVELFTMFNLEQTLDFTSDLVITGATAVSGDTSILSVLDQALVIEAGDSAPGLAVLDTSTAGTYSSVWNIEYSDEDVLGAATGTLQLNLTGQVGALASFIPGDFDGSGQVEQGDLTLLLNNWGAVVADGQAPEAGWVNLDDITAPAIDQDELTLLLNNWGNIAPLSDVLIDEISIATGLSTSEVTALIPEPTSLSLLMLASGVGLMRRRTQR